MWARKSLASRDAVEEGEGIVRTADYAALGGRMVHICNRYMVCKVYYSGP